jgi:metal-responsive CopG/Arc/MetJ family transcriptional regulator
MRTTIELSPAHRAQLARLAAERGEKGFSRFIAEALEAYLRRTADEGPDGPRRLRGVLGESEARDLEERVRKIREDWR